MHYFFDASALLKRYVREVGSDWVCDTTRPQPGQTIYIAQVTPLEIISALARLRRVGQMTDRTMQAARLHVQRHVARQYQVITLVPAIFGRAERLIDRYDLFAADALQLACVLSVEHYLLATGLVTFVSADDRLLAAAHGEGLLIHNPL